MSAHYAPESCVGGEVKKSAKINIFYHLCFPLSVSGVSFVKMMLSHYPHKICKVQRVNIPLRIKTRNRDLGIICYWSQLGQGLIICVRGTHSLFSSNHGIPTSGRYYTFYTLKEMFYHTLHFVESLYVWNMFKYWGGPKDPQLSKLLNALKWVFKSDQNVFDVSSDDFRKIFDQTFWIFF